MYSTARSSESESVVHDSGQLKKYHDLSGVLNALQQNIEEAKTEYKGYKISKTEKEKLENILRDMKGEFSESEKFLKEVKLEIEKTILERRALDREKNALVSEIEEKKMNLVSFQKEMVEHEGYVANLKKTATDLDIVIAQKHSAHHNIIVDHEKQIGDMAIQRKDLNLSILDEKKLLEFLNDKKHKIEDMVNEKKAEYENILHDIEKVTEVRENLREQNRKDQEDHFAIIKESADKLDEREQVVKKREGDASLKEFWLTDKENSLKNIKGELEKHYNRKFDNIKF